MYLPDSDFDGADYEFPNWLFICLVLVNALGWIIEFLKYKEIV